MTPTEQLKKWVKGESVHNTEKDECCPDFSCCREVTTDQHVKERFLKAHLEDDQYTTHEMLMMFLGGAFAEEKIYVAGGDPGGTA